MRIKVGRMNGRAHVILDMDYYAIQQWQDYKWVTVSPLVPTDELPHDYEIPVAGLYRFAGFDEGKDEPGLWEEGRHCAAGQIFAMLNSKIPEGFTTLRDWEPVKEGGENNWMTHHSWR